ncbi:RICIN domain-containing protein [Micromonospora sp. NBC_00330]|uniref:ricin-type beta-trefoil lectin domain protein n=1 Tax=Micromonospora sp. NBC_00330 TaxID=2903585 RepID=UPI002E2DAFB9|nr:ricin-type beta-trefoil lectin domain protein [Micromonospora sp. NBC_00330]
MTVRRRLWRLASIGAVATVLLGSLGLYVAPSAPAQAATSQFRGVNWADTRDNFLYDENVPIGLSKSDSYATTYTKATAILRGFQSFGSNTVRFGINPQTTASPWWGSLTAAYDAANAMGMNVMIAPWPPTGGRISDMNAFYTMWDTVIAKYGSNSRFYFNIVNEPWGYSATELTNLAAAFLQRYSSIPRGRIVVPGLWSDIDLCAVGADSRLNGTLLSIHMYTLGGETHPTEAEWINSFKARLCGYADRAILTEFGVPMNTGVNYNGPRDGNNNVSYFYALTDTVRELGMGSLLWTGVKEANQTQGPGPCFNASCAITSLTGSGTNLSLTVTNQSGLDRLRHGWGLDGPTTPPTGSGNVLRGVGSNRCLDVPSASTANGTQVAIWDCNGGSNQRWVAQPNGALQVYGNKCLDVPGHSTTAGARVQIWDCNGGANQQWTLNGDGSVVGRESGLCLDVTSAGTANGSTVQTWNCTGGNNQKWTRQ